MRTATVIFIILINIKFIYSGFLTNFEAIKKYANKPNYLRQNLENDSILESKYDRVFNLYTERYSFKLCLSEDKDIVSRELTTNGIFKSIKLYIGIVCNEPTEKVVGSIINSIFHGTIYKNNSKIYYFEDVGKYLKDIDCPECHSIAYSSDDIDNSVLNSYNLSCGNDKKHLFKFDDIQRASYRQIYDRKSQSTPNSYANKYCELAIYIHYSYLDKYISLWSALGEIASHIVTLNQALTKQISNNGDPLILYQISLVSKVDSASIYEDSVTDPNKLLAKLAETANKNKYCSAGFYVSQEWSGVLGLAYVGNAQGTGICGNNAVHVVTLQANGEIMPSSVHTVTTVHEIGHNLGSSHDPADGCNPPSCFNINRKAECSPLGNFFLMSIYSTSGKESNNLIYSPCSVDAINAIVTSPSRRICLKDKIKNLCGNGIIEAGEECDSGFADDKCCGSTSSAMPCKIIQGVCSPSQGECCDAPTCTYKSASTICGELSNCLITTKCTGNSASCPPAKFQPDDTECNHNATLCLKGDCTKSICTKFSGSECRCDGDNSCSVCCFIHKSGPASCIPLLFSPENVTKTVVAGTTCTNGTLNGICSSKGQCTVANYSTPIFDLLKFFLTGEVLTLLTSLFSIYVEFFIIGIALFLILFATLARLFSVNGTKKLRNYRKSFDMAQKPAEIHHLEKKVDESINLSPNSKFFKS